MSRFRQVESSGDESHPHRCILVSAEWENDLKGRMGGKPTPEWEAGLFGMRKGGIRYIALPASRLFYKVEVLRTRRSKDKESEEAKGAQSPAISRGEPCADEGSPGASLSSEVGLSSALLVGFGGASPLAGFDELGAADDEALSEVGALQPTGVPCVGPHSESSICRSSTHQTARPLTSHPPPCHHLLTHYDVLPPAHPPHTHNGASVRIHTMTHPPRLL